jgi:hypothetical protein
VPERKPELTGLWVTEVRPFRPGQLTPAEPTTAGLSRLQSELAASSSVTGEAAFLDALTRFAHRDRTRAISWLRSAAAQTNASRLVRTAARWADGGLDHTEHIKSIEHTAVQHSGIDRGSPSPLTSMPVTAAFSWLLRQETILRLGEAPLMLSTPSFDTGVLNFEDFSKRLVTLSPVGYGPLDLAQALLRLEPLPASTARELPPLSVPAWAPDAPWPRLFNRAGARLDAVQIARDWITLGGARYPDAVVDGLGWSVPPLYTPVDPAVFASAPITLLEGVDPVSPRKLDSWNSSVDTTVGVLPHWPELFATMTLIGSELQEPLLPTLVRAGRAGPAVHTLVARELADPDEAPRLVGADALMTLVKRGQFDSELFSTACVRLLATGELSLARTSSALEHVMLVGGMQAVWPGLLALVGHACATTCRPPGTANLLALVSKFAPAVPGRAMPDSVRALL